LGKEGKNKEYSREAGRRGGAPQNGPRKFKLGKEGKNKEYSREAGLGGGAPQKVPRKFMSVLSVYIKFPSYQGFNPLA
jgi:general stress protein YciG